MYGNAGTNFAIDTDTDMDSNLDGVSDNDIDNKEATSYTDGSVFAIGNFGNSKTKTRKIRLSTYNGSTLLASKVITVNLDFVTENPGNDNLSELSTEKLSLSEKEKLDRLAAAIRNLTDGDRILAMQDYNNMVENWDSMIERTTHLVNIETSIMNSQTVDQSAKETIVGIINEMFQEWSQTGNEIETAIKLVRILTSESSSASEIQEKLDQIFSHPNNIEANRPLARDILSLIQHDEKIPENNKIAIKNALRAVIDGGSANIDPSSIEKSSDA